MVSPILVEITPEEVLEDPGPDPSVLRVAQRYTFTRHGSNHAQRLMIYIDGSYACEIIPRGSMSSERGSKMVYSSSGIKWGASSVPPSSLQNRSGRPSVSSCGPFSSTTWGARASWTRS